MINGHSKDGSIIVPKSDSESDRHLVYSDSFDTIRDSEGAACVTAHHDLNAVFRRYGIVVDSVAHRKESAV
jgi:hypothetical protein